MTDPLILSLDPSSTKTGVCLMDYQERLLFAALLAPSRGVTAPVERIREMAVDLLLLLSRYRPAVVAIEWPSGHAHRKRHTGGGAGLAVYGAAVGALWFQAEAWAARRTPAAVVVPVMESEWTAGRAKAARTASIAALYRSYEPAGDPGGDIADAIGLALWTARTRRLAAP